MQNLLKQAISEITDVTHLADPTVAMQHIPSSAQFATMVTIMMLDNPNEFKLHFQTGTKFGPLTEAKQLGLKGEKQTGYLYHDGTAVYFTTETEVVYTLQPADVTGINKSYEDFF